MSEKNEFEQPTFFKKIKSYVGLDTQKKVIMNKTERLFYFPKNTERIFTVLVGLFTLSCLFPLLFVIIISLSTEESIQLFGYQIIPDSMSLDGYRYLWKMREPMLQSLAITIFITVVGTSLMIYTVGTYAYVISRNSFHYRKQLTVMILITMMFAGGLVPSYIVMTQVLKLKDTVWALILPGIFSPWFVLVMRTFYKRSVPEPIIEAAKIDGASELRIFFQIVVPLAIPGLATIGLFSALGYWNDWFGAMLYIENPDLVPLQYLLVKIQSTIDFIAKNPHVSLEMGETVRTTLPKEATRMAMVVFATLPIALIYPRFQKFFLQGLTIGGVKE